MINPVDVDVQFSGQWSVRQERKILVTRTSRLCVLQRWDWNKASRSQMSKGREGLVWCWWASRAAVQYPPTSKQCEFGSWEQWTEHVSPHFWPFLNVIYTGADVRKKTYQSPCQFDARQWGKEECLRGNHFPLAFSKFWFVQLKIQPDK